MFIVFFYWEDRVHLFRLRCGHHNVLLFYRKRIHPEVTDTCPLCHIGAHTIHHIMEECLSLDSLRHSHTPPLYVATDDLWDCPAPSVAFLRSDGLFDQCWLESNSATTNCFYLFFGRTLENGRTNWFNCCFFAELWRMGEQTAIIRPTYRRYDGTIKFI